MLREMARSCCTRALALRKQGVSADDAGKQIGAELNAKYTDWPSRNVTGFVKSVYAEQELRTFRESLLKMRSYADRSNSFNSSRRTAAVPVCSATH